MNLHPHFGPNIQCRNESYRYEELTDIKSAGITDIPNKQLHSLAALHPLIVDRYLKYSVKPIMKSILFAITQLSLRLR